MKVLSRWKELERKIQIVPDGYSPKLSPEDELEYRTVLTIMNVLTSQTETSTIHRDVLLHLLKQIGWNVAGFKKGKFRYD